MATRSNIIAKHADGRWGRIYCHWDGYPEHVGATLLRHYTDPERIEKLIALGALSSLHKEINPATDAHRFDTPEPDVCIAYGRDRGEEGVEPMFHDTLEAALADMEEYAYVWDGETWSYSDHGLPLAPLTPAVCGF